MRTVVFDLDGTLADTSGDLIAAANHCFRDMGFGDVLSVDTDAGVALRGGRRMLSEGLTRLGRMDAAVVDQYYPILLKAYGDAISEHTVFYPGALEAVRTLRNLGYGVGICTNKPEALADQLMREMGARDAFGALVGADTLPVRKPDPAPLIETVHRLGGDPAKTILIGDSDTDHNTARAAGVPSVLVTFGPSGEDMAALEPDALLHDYAELPDLVQALIGRNS
ncbi:HAD-IA family hydrolase [Shimia sp.]|uniref:HAD-IA family hydrolase n=1 Tax=Shimia sp. TaxID=1954381 RepID=UPI003298AF7C